MLLILTLQILLEQSSTKQWLGFSSTHHNNNVSPDNNDFQSLYST